MQIILDISANTHKNNIGYFCKMLEQISRIDNSLGHEIIIKGQLFAKAGDNIPQDKGMFLQMYDACRAFGVLLTASVFDEESLAFLLHFDVPFIKIANNRQLDWLIGEIPRKIWVYRSVLPEEYWSGNHYEAGNLKEKGITPLCCVSKYPAKEVDYLKGAHWHWQNRLEHTNRWDWLQSGLGQRWFSDHTVGLDFCKRAKPTIWEKHFKLEDSTGLDAGDWAITPEQLREVMNVHW
jgi:sialic acid synthase SpsE